LPDAKYDAQKVLELKLQTIVAGRIVALRSFGNLVFFRLRDDSGECQILCKKNSLGEDFKRLSVAGGELEVADFALVEGTVTVSKTGELSIEATSLRLLTKAYRPPPEKWHGLSDVEVRYRRRYIDLVASPDVADVFVARALIVRSIRNHLDSQGFLEVETPTLNSLIGGATARPFTTHHNALDMHLFMRIAPELYLKRCLVGGFERVYEIGRCYRNEGISTRHNPEFTMLEFYQAYATYEHLMDATESLLRYVDDCLAKAMPSAHAKWSSERPFTLEDPFARVTMERASLDALTATGVPDLKAAAASGLGAVLALFEGDFGPQIKAWAASATREVDWGNFRRGYAKCENPGERLFSIYEYFAEPYLPADYTTSKNGTPKSLPVFVIDHPFEISPLARKKDGNPQLTDRFELFVAGRELCNAFSELNDPEDQAARFQEQVAKKSRGAEETMDYDADYVRALEHGMPPAAGFGMGIDRLVMMLCNQASIRDVILFPLLRPEAST
jgi:lysyl-tRNA synthetase class 2